MSIIQPATPTVKVAAVRLGAFDPAIAAFLAGIPELRIPVVPVAATPADSWGPETDADRWVPTDPADGPRPLYFDEGDAEPAEADRAWHARQQADGYMVEGESDRSDLAGRTLDAWTWRLERMAEAVEAQDRLEAGIPTW